MSKAKILIVEDEVIVSVAFRADLQKLGYSVCSLATSVEKAIKIAEHELPDIVLMDIRLHGENDGFEAAKEIHSRFGIPIIYMTGYPVEMLIKEERIKEPYEYLAKPVESLDMKKKIESALQKHKEDLGKKKDM
jgi:DNA-binding NtrC family response regulator